MISERGLAALRAAATLAHALPLQVRLHHDGEPVAAVARPPFTGTAQARLITPCAFRSAVGEAWLLHRQGQPVAFCGLPDHTEPAISVGVPPGGDILPGGIYQVPWPDGVLSVFATTACAAITGGAAAAAGAEVHHDRVTGVTLVQLASVDARAAEAVTRLEDVLATVATEELLAALG